MQQASRSYLITFVAKSALLLFCSVLLQGVYTVANPTTYTQLENNSSISNTHIYTRNAGDSNDSGVQNMIFDEEVSELPKFSFSLPVSMFMDGGISKVTKSFSSGYISPPFKNIIIVCLSSVFLLI